MHSQSKYYYEIDMLRGLACLAVLLYHLPIYRVVHIPFAFSGVAGVRLFFVISGFIIAFSINKISSSECNGIIASFLNGFKNNKSNIYNFWYRRFVRLFPGLCLLFCSIFVVVIYLGWQRNILPESIFGFIKYLSLFCFLDNTGTTPLYPNAVAGIMASVGASIVWTLNCEILFYLTMPFLMLFRNFRKFLPYIWLGFFLIKFIIFIFVPGAVIYFSKVTHFDEFFLGVLIALYYDKISLNSTILNIMTIAAVSNFAIGNPAIEFSYGDYLNQLFSSGVLVYVAALQRNKLKLPYIGPMLHFVGVRSYFIYLMHLLINFVLSAPVSLLYKNLAVKYLHIQNMIDKNSATLDQFKNLVVVVVTLILSDLFYRFIERPFIEKNKHKYLAK